MFRNYRARLILLCCLASPLANAANVDLTTFTLTRGPDLGSEVSSTEAYLDPNSSLSSSLVTNIASFEWNFTAYAPEDAIAYFGTTAQIGNTLLATSDTVHHFGTTFWQTYNFATPYTGPLSFAMLGEEQTAVVLKIRNVVISDIPSLPNNPTVPAVPEPESYAMLVAGLGLMAGISRRRAKRNAQGAAAVQA
jgi:hypothetical protein